MKIIINENQLDIIKENIENELNVHHGSMSNFDKFDSSFMGTGEGAQIYGWGIYLTQNQDVAEFYIRNAFIQGKQRQENNNFIRKLKLKKSIYDKRYEPDAYGQVNGFLYGVEIPEDNGVNYINWNENNPQVLLNIVQSLKNNIDNNFYQTLCQGIQKSSQRNRFTRFMSNFGNGISNFHFLYEKLSQYFGNSKNTSLILDKVGFVGIKVPINNKKQASTSQYNFVIFNENNIQIVGKTKISYDNTKIDYTVQPNMSHKSIVAQNKIY